MFWMYHIQIPHLTNKMFVCFRRYTVYIDRMFGCGSRFAPTRNVANRVKYLTIFKFHHLIYPYKLRAGKLRFRPATKLQKFSNIYLSRTSWNKIIPTDFWPATSCGILDIVGSMTSWKKPKFRRRNFLGPNSRSWKRICQILDF